MSNHILPWWLSYAQHPHAMSKSNNHSVSDIVCFFFSSLSTISVCYVLEGLSVLRSRDTRSKPAHVQGHALLCVLSHCIRDWAYFGALCVRSRGGWVFVLVDCSVSKSLPLSSVCYFSGVSYCPFFRPFLKCCSLCHLPQCLLAHSRPNGEGFL